MQSRSNAISIPTNGAPNNTAKPRPKRILVCAPSNAAIDEIARRLIEGVRNVQGQTYKPSILRVGNQSSIHPDVIKFSLNYLVDQRAGMNSYTAAEAKSANVKELEEFQKSLQLLRAKQVEFPNQDFNAEIDEIIKQIDKVKQIREQLKNADRSDKDRLKITADYLLGADVMY